MNRFSFLIYFFISFVSASTLYADGTYYIGNDEGGVYFQTRQIRTGAGTLTERICDISKSVRKELITSIRIGMELIY